MLNKIKVTEEDFGSQDRRLHTDEVFTDTNE